MTKQEIEGVILHLLPYGDYDQILTLFTKEQGLLKLMAKGASRNSSRPKFCTTPLTSAQFIVSKGRGELLNCTEISPYNQHLNLRNSLLSLQAAGIIVRALLSSQQQQKPAPLLYALLLSYLKEIGNSPNPATFGISFQLKVLRHEGLMFLTPNCSICHQICEEIRMSEGQCFCQEHSPAESTSFTAHESDLLLLLTYGRSLQQISSLPIEQSFQDKISILFENIYIS